MSKVEERYVGVWKARLFKRRSGFVIRCVKKEKVEINRSLVVLRCETDSLGGVSCCGGFDRAEVVSNH